MLTERIRVNDDVFVVRSAAREDVPAIVALLTDDVLGRHREAAGPDLAPYLRAFDRIEAHPNQELLVVERDGEVVGTLDLAILASLSRQGSLRLQVEAVRVASALRGSGLGGAIFDWIVTYGRRNGCSLVQLTSDRARPGAHAFYERLGFVDSHIGYKLDLRDTD